MSERLLVPIGADDESRVEKLAAEATNLVTSTDGTVVLLYVFEGDSFADDVNESQESVEGLGGDVRSQEPTPDEVARRRTVVDDVVGRLDEAGVDVEVHGKIGTTPEAILSGAEEFGADHVLIGGRKRTATGKAVFGSVAQDVMMNADVPVTFVRE